MSMQRGDAMSELDRGGARPKPSREASVYQLFSPSLPGAVFIGCSRCPLLCQRLRTMRQQYGRYLEGRGPWQAAYTLLSRPDVDIQLLEKVRGPSGADEMKAHAQRWVAKTPAAVNATSKGRRAVAQGKGDYGEGVTGLGDLLGGCPVCGERMQRRAMGPHVASHHAWAQRREALVAELRGLGGGDDDGGETPA